MDTGIWRKAWSVVAMMMSRRNPRTAAPKASPSAFQSALADDFRRLQACQAKLAGNRERLRQLSRGADRSGTGGGLRAIAEFEALARQPHVTPQTVRQAFRELAKLCHPDHGGDPRLFARLYQSYQRMIEARVHDQSQSA